MADKAQSSKLVERALKRALTEAPFRYEPNLCPHCHKDMGDGEGDPGANVIYGPGGAASCPHCHGELPDIAAGEELPRGGAPNRRGRPPEGGPMPDAKNLDPAETALAIQTAYFHDNEEELAAWADAIKNGGMSPADLLEFGYMLTKLQKGNEIYGALVNHLRLGEPQE